MSNIKINEYIQSKRNRLKLRYRLSLGLQQLKRPYNTIPVFLIILISIKIWKLKGIFLTRSIPTFFQPIYQHIIHVSLILTSISLLLGFFYYIGYRAARKDEACLIVAFSAEALISGGYPILISRKKEKGNVIIREFSTDISMKTWLETKESIADQMNEHFVAEIEYGSRNNSVRLYTAPKRIQTTRGTLYEEV
ncbi:hypothetical protein [Lacrimispora sp.]|uniref:hypothetical protein n=1 Tax=Lacrimispora sp. TaxID=2719234 RepID=UPI0028A0C99E|nr:hypothetical protein [Lacrimispora sp.]